MSIGEAVNFFEQYFENFALKGYFSKKCKNFAKFFKELQLQTAVTLQRL